ncbi:ABC transporter substrate-binding protein [Paenibacillus donghaensis]|uniref:ABC transporter substrate-binding protein n=1 Tax=Paenibacillus donghaensis TaxID=414771 RepID=A0A2Z2KE10_9BACL|nr:extracellular solute-binding protein [Paenibacillus donghaensis]ASA23927.1 ABC transporter substrate-binding protein [Paenibacillus donghaensis]
MNNCKRLLTMLLAVSLLLAITGCASKAANEEEGASAEGGPVKLRIMWWGSQERHEATLKVLDMYTQKNPNVTFEPEYSGMDGYLDKLSTQAAARNAPDVIQLDPSWIKDWVSRKQLADLTSTVNVGDIDSKLMPIGQIEGKNYAIPLGFVAEGMIYDKTSLEKLGVSPPNNGWTWDDFFAMADSLKGKLPAGQYFIKNYAGDPFAYSAYQYARGKGQLVTDDGKFNVDQTTFLDWANKFEQMRKEGLVPPADVNTSDKEFDPTGDLLVTNKIIFRLAYSNQFGAWNSMKPDSLAMVTLPKMEEAGGWLKPSMFFGVAESSKHQKEAAKFIEWFVNDPEPGAVLGTKRGAPVNNKVQAAIEADLSADDRTGMELLHATQKDGQTFSPGAPGWTNFIDKDFALVRDELSFGAVTPEEAYKSLEKASQEYVK